MTTLQFLTSTSALHYSEPQLASTTTRQLEINKVIYDHLQSDTISLKDRNKNLILILQQSISDNDWIFLKSLFAGLPWGELHPSLLQSALIMTEHVAPLKKETREIRAILDDVL